MKKVRIAALADLHVRETSVGQFNELFAEISRMADIFVLCGDLTDLGLPEQTEVLATELRSLTIPAVGVLGNHDFQSDKGNEVKAILRRTNMFVLDTEPTVIDDIGFAGTKGFAGGFEKYALASFGEPILKQFVQETLNETLMLENQLKELENQGVLRKIVVMHYSPIRWTLEGESLEVYSFLGSSRFVEPIEAYETTAVFHGHAHHGIHQGKTKKGIPVYNVSYPVMQRLNPKQPYAVIEV